jgi:hypothetical protein
MAALSRLDLGRNPRTRLGPEFSNTLLAARLPATRCASEDPEEVENSPTFVEMI